MVVMPHLICTVLAMIFNGLGLFHEKSWFALVGAILYTVAFSLIIPLLLLVIVEMILSYIGFAPA